MHVVSMRIRRIRLNISPPNQTERWVLTVARRFTSMESQLQRGEWTTKRDYIALPRE